MFMDIVSWYDILHISILNILVFRIYFVFKSTSLIFVLVFITQQDRGNQNHLRCFSYEGNRDKKAPQCRHLSITCKVHIRQHSYNPDVFFMFHFFQLNEGQCIKHPFYDTLQYVQQTYMQYVIALYAQNQLLF